MKLSPQTLANEILWVARTLRGRSLSASDRDVAHLIGSALRIFYYCLEEHEV